MNLQTHELTNLQLTYLLHHHFLSITNVNAFLGLGIVFDALQVIPCVVFVVCIVSHFFYPRGRFSLEHKFEICANQHVSQVQEGMEGRKLSIICGLHKRGVTLVALCIKGISSPVELLRSG